MKKFLTAVAMALLLVGCAKETVDLSGINEKLAELDNRVSALEGAIASIQSAVGDGVFVQKVEQYADPETGKTIGVTVTYTSGKVVYFEISPKADYSGPVLSVIRSGEGSLVWAVDGVAVKVDGKEVPVNKTPTFTIDEEGYLWVSIDGGDPVKLGPVKSEGASLVDGIFKDIKVEQDKVVLVLSDDSIVNIPFAEAFKLNIEKNEYVYDAGKSVTIPYTVSAKTEMTEVGVTGYNPERFYVQVTDENIIITPLYDDANTTMLVYADSKVGLVSLVNIMVSPECAYVIDPYDYETDCDYVTESEGGTIEMHVVSNVEIEAKVAEEDTWISIISTKSTKYTITAKIEENTGAAREGRVRIYKKGTDKRLQTIWIYQAKTSAVTNLSKNGTANSYIVTKAGDYKFKTVKGNSAESVGTVAKAEILWETENTTTAPEANSVIAAVGVDGDYIVFSTPETLKPGNALIAAKDASDKILWSWHIWIPETEIETSTFGGIVKNAMMDRNLGALVATAPNDAVNGKSIGMLYQWGRKDPFPGASSVSSSDPIAVHGSISLSSDKTNFTVAETIENPTVYVKTGGDSNKTWMTDEEKSTQFWGVDKTIYDPCPPGYVTPTRNKEEMLWGKTATFTVDETNKLLTIAASAEASECAVFPIAGYLDQGEYANVGARMYLWSSYSSSSEKNIAYQLYIKGTAISVEEQRMSRGGNIRCVVDANALPPVTDLGEKGTANSYIITESGDYKFKAVKGNSTESVGTVASAELVWETNNTSTAPEVNSIIAKVGMDEGFITFSTPATLVPGNALIAAKDAEGKILWSWHIWIPQTAVKAGSFGAAMGASVAVMDRNLGALVVTEASETEKADILSFGLFYQWGRKDPFPGFGATDKSPMALAGVQMTKQDTPITTDESIANPTLYAWTKTEGKSEGFNWNTEEIFGAWGDEGGKTIYDPCPVGYRVPVKGDWCAAGTQWTFKMDNWWFKLGDAVFPYAGYMDDNGGSFSKLGERNVFWTATHESLTNAKCAYIKSEAFNGDSARTARSGSVRCVAEKPIS